MPSESPVAHVVSHSHWDREWYKPFEFFRYRLVDLMNRLLDGMLKDRSYRFFHLDGQTVILEDYLEIHPERADLLRRMIQSGRIKIGPFYVLQDEFLVSGEANLRSLLHGHIDCERWGAIEKIGYLPDNFGNISQMPQLLRGFGIDTVVFGRGIQAYQPSDSDPGRGTGQKAEMVWRGADGSEVFSVLMTRWYNNGMDLVFQSPEEIEQVVQETARTALARDILVMHGCDHQPVNLDIPSAIRRYNRWRGRSMRLKHSNLSEYVAAVRTQLDDRVLPKVDGEMTSEDSDGIHTLAETASSRISLKQANDLCQLGLERWAEPLGLLAHLRGGPDPRGFLRYAWRSLMKNHPHDSICGCSSDEVHREMETRFEKVRQVTDELALRSMAFLAGAAHQGGLPGRITVFNAEPFKRNAAVDIEVEIAPEHEVTPGQLCLLDARGREVAAWIEDLGLLDRYRLPDDRFREVYSARVLRLRFLAENIPPAGWAEWRLAERRHAPVPNPPAKLLQQEGAHTISNEFFRVTAEQKTGWLIVEDLRTGEVYRQLCGIEDNGDAGDEYRHTPPETDRCVRSWKDAEISIIPLDTGHPEQVGLELKFKWAIPASTDGRSRSQRLLKEVVVEKVMLTRGVPWIEVEISGDNRARDHRIRAVFRTGAPSETSVAATPFDVVERKIARGPQWVKPGNPQRHSRFFGRVLRKRGLTIATRGLMEYEALPDPDGTLCLTLLRCTGEIGDWYPFATHDSQCIGTWHAEFALIPGSPLTSENQRRARAYANPPRCYAPPLPIDQRDEDVAPEFGGIYCPMEVSGAGIEWTAFKPTEREGQAMIRLVNSGKRKTTAVVVFADDLGVRGLLPMNLNEEPVGAVLAPVEPGRFEIPLGKKEIATFRLETTRP
jgi:alpha-mannosidase